LESFDLRVGVALGASALLSGALCLGAPAAHAARLLPDSDECEALKTEDPVLKGWCLGINNRKGNCIACHNIVTSEPWPEAVAPGGNVAPPLVAMKARFPDRAKLRAQVYDATAANRFSMMPPFGKHKVISEEELDDIVEWLYSL
jgi:sulfur-oxidizing protein SoxX